MKGIIISGLADTLPSVANGSGKIQKEDLYRYAKRSAEGKMRRIGYIGYTLSIEFKWSVLKRAQYEALISTITQTSFDISFRWQGSTRTEAFYAGNISATPFRLDSSSLPLYYKDVSFSAISVDVLTET